MILIFDCLLQNPEVTTWVKRIVNINAYLDRQ